MPKGIPVATVAINNAANAALLAARILAVTDSDLWERCSSYKFPSLLNSKRCNLLISACVFPMHSIHGLDRLIKHQEGMKDTVLRKAEKLEGKGWKKYLNA